MIEAIGEKQFGSSSPRSTGCSRPAGIACVQTILIPDERCPRYRATPDWIERYVFPGCLIPSLAALSAGAWPARRAFASPRRGDRAPLRRDAAPLARALPRRLAEAVRALGYDERFVRTWDFYLAVCEAGFRARWLRDAQLVLTPVGGLVAHSSCSRGD